MIVTRRPSTLAHYGASLVRLWLQVVAYGLVCPFRELEKCKRVVGSGCKRTQIRGLFTSFSIMLNVMAACVKLHGFFSYVRTDGYICGIS